MSYDFSKTYFKFYVHTLFVIKQKIFFKQSKFKKLNIVIKYKVNQIYSCLFFFCFCFTFAFTNNVTLGRQGWPEKCYLLLVIVKLLLGDTCLNWAELLSGAFSVLVLSKKIIITFFKLKLKNTLLFFWQHFDCMKRAIFIRYKCCWTSLL